VTARYDDDEYEPTIRPNPYIIPAIPPGKDVAFDMFTTFASSPPREGVRPDGFPLSGTFTEHSRQNTYPIITDWSA
jgi:hypothetical protein